MDEKLMFDSSTATEYDRGIRRTLPTYDGLIRLASSALRLQADEHAHVLLVGAGGGNELMEFAEIHPGWTFTAADPSEPMLIQAAQKASGLASGRVKFVLGSAADVQADEPADAAACLLVLHFIEGMEAKRQLLADIRARLKTGAPFVIASMAGAADSAELDAQFALWRQHWLDRTSLNAEQGAEMEKGIRALSFLPKEEIEQLLSDAGFGGITPFFQTTFFHGWLCVAV
ncbi:methyltransferase [Sporosarcina sp. NCCP-2716]|uniref:class I SAM-dependent methyltransferase n=1 Tax=Sporosarcina sp. NCCP-2716 TaxID=2943679 RepID=UPI00203C7344|nr:class I SAM-dependent methyltransferase [Sporosarcina sp. NCCP-2716]GKV69807.1 methyltransferase [Sporosarcina sp. NCCP-2716]